MESMQLTYHQAMKNRDIISVFTEEIDTEPFIVGCIIAITNDWILVNNISPNGCNDGLYLISPQDIGRISSGGLYEEKIKKLYIMQKQTPLPDFHAKDLLSAILIFSQSNDLLVSCDIRNRNTFECCGYVENIGNGTVTLHTYDDWGNAFSEIIVKMDYISRIACNTDYEKNIKALISNS